MSMTMNIKSLFLVIQLHPFMWSVDEKYLLQDLLYFLVVSILENKL